MREAGHPIRVKPADQCRTVFICDLTLVGHEDLLDILRVNEAVVDGVQAGDGRILREVLGAPELLLEGLSLTVKFYLHG